MDIIAVDTSDRRHSRRFLGLPFRLYRDTLQWVPPLAPDARRMLDRQRHPFYKHSDAAFFLAVDRGPDAGRLVVVNKGLARPARGPLPHPARPARSSPARASPTTLP